MIPVLPMPDIEELAQLLEPDFDAGTLRWCRREHTMFPDSGHGGARGAAARWNARYAGRYAADGEVADDYKRVTIHSVKYLAHRLLWKMRFSADPIELDHINGNVWDNRIANLREVSHQQNSMNVRTPSHNTSGVVGVCWNSRESKWKARLRLKGRDIHLGTFDTFDAAVAARQAANRKYRFHQNHGRIGASV